MKSKITMVCSKCGLDMGYCLMENVKQCLEFARVEKICRDCQHGKTKTEKDKKPFSYYNSNKGIRKDIHATYYFKSNLEANFARILKDVKVNWLYEPTKYDFYKYDSLPKSYTPDFKIIETNDTAKLFNLELGLYEIKGFMNQKQVIKFKRFKECYPEQANRLTVIVLKREDYQTMGKLGYRVRYFSDYQRAFKNKLANHWE